VVLPKKQALERLLSGNDKLAFKIISERSLLNQMLPSVMQKVWRVANQKVDKSED